MIITPQYFCFVFLNEGVTEYRNLLIFYIGLPWLRVNTIAPHKGQNCINIKVSPCYLRLEVWTSRSIILSRCMYASVCSTPFLFQGSLCVLRGNCTSNTFKRYKQLNYYYQMGVSDLPNHRRKFKRIVKHTVWHLHWFNDSVSHTLTKAPFPVMFCHLTVFSQLTTTGALPQSVASPRSGCLNNLKPRQMFVSDSLMAVYRLLRVNVANHKPNQNIARQVVRRSVNTTETSPNDECITCLQWLHRFIVQPFPGTIAREMEAHRKKIIHCTLRSARPRNPLTYVCLFVIPYRVIASLKCRCVVLCCRGNSVVQCVPGLSSSTLRLRFRCSPGEGVSTSPLLPSGVFLPRGGEVPLWLFSSQTRCPASGA